MEEYIPTKDKEKKLYILDYFKIALFMPRKYKVLLKQSDWGLVKYLLVVGLIMTMMQGVIPALGAVVGLGGLDQIILYQMPDFSFKDGELSIDGKFEFDEKEVSTYYLIDTSVEHFDEEDIPDGMIQVFLISRTNMLLYNRISGMPPTIQEEKFSDYKEINLDNKKLTKWKPLIYVCFVIYMIIFFVMLMIKYLVTALIFAGFNMLYVKLLASPISFGNVFKIALYAQTVCGIYESIATYGTSSGLQVLAITCGTILMIFLMNRAIVNIAMPKNKNE